MMKCPHCGHEIPEGTQCKTCVMEIQYKDFRGSEMLDIRLPSPLPGPKIQVKQKSPPIRGKETAQPQLPERRPAASTPVFFLVAAISIIIAAVAWYYLLTFLLNL